jgi:hypothetical protein
MSTRLMYVGWRDWDFDSSLTVGKNMPMGQEVDFGESSKAQRLSSARSSKLQILLGLGILIPAAESS